MGALRLRGIATAAALLAGTAAGLLPAAPAAADTAPATPAAAVTTAPAVVHLKTDHKTVKAGAAVTFTVTEKTAAGAPLPGRATFSVKTKSGWVKKSTAALSATGSATFTFHPDYTHEYRADLAAVTAGGVSYGAVRTAPVKVTVDIGARIVAAAAAQKGEPYRFGAAGPHSFDCSGLTKYVFAKFGITLPHSANAQQAYGHRVSAKDAKPGDLVFVVSGGHASHVAIYAGHGRWWEAPHTGANVRLVKIWSTSVVYRHVR
jgi:cell wall-associated NlpC family hydrolase